MICKCGFLLHRLSLHPLVFSPVFLSLVQSCPFALSLPVYLRLYPRPAVQSNVMEFSLFPFYSCHNFRHWSLQSTFVCSLNMWDKCWILRFYRGISNCPNWRDWRVPLCVPGIFVDGTSVCESADGSFFPSRVSDPVSVSCRYEHHAW